MFNFIWRPIFGQTQGGKVYAYSLLPVSEAICTIRLVSKHDKSIYTARDNKFRLYADPFASTDLHKRIDKNVTCLTYAFCHIIYWHVD